jgi:hypothetical protein
MATEPNQNPTPAPAPAPAPEKTYTEAELNTRIEAARTEEKNKLYGEINGLKEKLTQAGLTVQERDALKQQLADAQGQLSAIQKAQSDKGVDPLLLAKQVAEDTRKAVSTEFGAKLDAMQRSLDESNAARRKQELASYRASLIAAANGRTIPAMIVGNSEAELDAAAKEASKQYEEIAASSSNSPAPAPGAGAPPPVNPRANGGGMPNQPGLDGFTRSGDPSTYGKNRQQTLAALKQRFG